MWRESQQLSSKWMHKKNKTKTVEAVCERKINEFEFFFCCFREKFSNRFLWINMVSFLEGTQLLKLRRNKRASERARASFYSSQRREEKEKPEPKKTTFPLDQCARQQFNESISQQLFGLAESKCEEALVFTSIGILIYRRKNNRRANGRWQRNSVAKRTGQMLMRWGWRIQRHFENEVEKTNCEPVKTIWKAKWFNCFSNWKSATEKTTTTTMKMTSANATRGGGDRSDSSRYRPMHDLKKLFSRPRFVSE